MVALGLQLCDGTIASDDGDKPMISDLFDDPAFDMARRESQEHASALRYMGEFEPARLPAETLEYTTLPQVLDKLKNRFKKA
jgi:fructose 1,6-bisphosphate aldolase/phosphatase